jgi:protein-S-isoprenylcysteine O-methyltransferase Ste14
MNITNIIILLPVFAFTHNSYLLSSFILVVIFLLGHVFWHPSRSILWMPFIVAICSHIFVILYEGPHLRKIFGTTYEQYCQQVPRWLPRLK